MHNISRNKTYHNFLNIAFGIILYRQLMMKTLLHDLQPNFCSYDY